MKPGTTEKAFEKVMDVWEHTLARYSMDQFLAKADMDVWSLGQVYMHLISDISDYNFEQIGICLATNRNQRKKKTAEGRQLFARNAFPPGRLKGPPGVPAPDQPRSLEELRDGWRELRRGFHHWLAESKRSPSKGKTRHPGFGWFNADDWLWFIVMHLRHHLKQKRRIEKFLST